MRRSLGGLAAVGLAVFLLLILVSQAAPEISVPEREKTNTEQQEQENVFDAAADRQNEMRDALRETQEQAEDNLFLVILRYLLTFALFAMTVLALAYGMVRLVFFLLERRRRVRLEFEEVVVADNVRRRAGEQEISPAQTPMELRKNYLGEGRKEELLTELYEKARYAEDSVTEEEFRKWQKEETT